MLMTGCDRFSACDGSVILRLPCNESKRQGSSRDWLPACGVLRGTVRPVSEQSLFDSSVNFLRLAANVFDLCCAFANSSVFYLKFCLSKHRQKSLHEHLKIEKMKVSEYHSGVLLYTRVLCSIYGDKLRPHCLRVHRGS